MKHYDVIIIGSGVAGMSTALYLTRAGYKVKIIGEELGGKLNTIPVLENVLGYGMSTDPAKLIESMNDQMFCHYVDGGTISEEGSIAELVKITENPLEKFNVTYLDSLTGRETISSKYMVVASGTSEKKLEYPNHSDSQQSHCVLCDGYAVKDRNVIAVGGGNTAFTEVIELAKIAKGVTMVIRRGLRDSDPEESLVQEVLSLSNVIIKEHSYLSSFDGEFALVEDSKNNHPPSVIQSEKIFSFTGWTPNLSFFDDERIIDSEGYLHSPEERCRPQETVIKGLFTVGDVSKRSPRQIVTALNDSFEVLNLIKELDKVKYVTKETALSEFIKKTSFDKGNKGSGVGIAIIDTGVSQELYDDVSIISHHKTIGTPTENIYSASTHGPDIFQTIKRVSPNAKFTIIRAMDDLGSGTSISILGALKVAKNSPDVDVIVMSLSSLTKLNPIVNAEISKILDSGTKIICSALGNDSRNIQTYPSSTPGVISVGACKDNSFEELYEKTNFRTDTDFVAIGKTDEFLTDGTSLANAIVSAQIANLLSDKKLSFDNGDMPEQIKKFASLNGNRKLIMGLGYLENK